MLNGIARGCIFMIPETANFETLKSALILEKNNFRSCNISKKGDIDIKALLHV